MSEVPGRVAVIGGGFAGCAAALRLARDGAQVTVFEAVAKPGPVGAGILLQPTGAAVLQRLGVYEHVAWRGTPVRSLHARTAGGFDLFELPYSLEREDIAGLGLHRGVLFEALFSEVQLTSAIDLRLGVMIVDVRSAASGAEVLDDEGKAHGPFDLIVVADGARSEIRARRFPTDLDQPYPWGALWFVAEDPDRVFPDVLEQVVEGSRHMLGFLPTGRGPVRENDPDPHDDPPLTSIFWSVRCDQEAAWRHTARRMGLQRWKDTITRFEPRAEPLIAQIEDHRQVLFAAYRDVRMRRWWHPIGEHAHLVFIGDAAHAMSPQLGQGSNLALIDAETLADAMADAASMEEGLRAYQAARRAHLGYYGWANRAVTPFFQSSSLAMGWLRDIAFPLACKVPGVRRLMVRTMAGMKRGLFFDDPIALPPPVADRPDE